MRQSLAVAVLVAALHPAAASAQETRPVEIRFAAEFGGAPFACGRAYEDVGTTGSTVSVNDFRLFVSEVALVRADGSAVFVVLDQDGVWQHQNVALLDFEDASGGCTNGTPPTNTAVRGRVPEGEYVGLVFTVGVPFALNHGDPTLAASPLNLSAMFWNWQGGYKFVKLDLSSTGRPAGADVPASHDGPRTGPGGWSLHLGSTVCAAASRTTPANSCANPNRMTVRFDRFDPATGTVVVDPAAVLAGADVDSNAPETSPGCMSFPGDADCVPVMPRLGFAYADEAPQPQALFLAR